MVGTERVRFCKDCSMNVYNLSSMSRKEAEALISNAEGRLCIRYYRRQDGTILTDNCPVGLRAIKRRLSRAANATLSAVLSFFAGLGIMAAVPKNDVGRLNSESISANELGNASQPDTIIVDTGTYAVEGLMEREAVGKMAYIPKQTFERTRKARRR
jgi:hypothetical protein